MGNSLNVAGTGIWNFKPYCYSDIMKHIAIVLLENEAYV